MNDSVDSCRLSQVRENRENRDFDEADAWNKCSMCDELWVGVVKVCRIGRWLGVGEGGIIQTDITVFELSCLMSTPAVVLPRYHRQGPRQRDLR